MTICILRRCCVGRVIGGARATSVFEGQSERYRGSGPVDLSSLSSSLRDRDRPSQRQRKGRL